MFSLVCNDYLTLYEFILRIKVLKMRKSEQSQSFLERATFYVEWNNCAYAARNGMLHFQLTKCEHKGVSEGIDSDDRNFSNVKPQKIFHFF